MMTEKAFNCETCADLGEIVVTDHRGRSKTVTCKDCCPHDDIYKYACTECHKSFDPTDFINEDSWRDE